jgi:hypothetical protein
MITFSYLFALFALFAFIISTVIILIECNYKKKSFISLQDTNAIRDKLSEDIKQNQKNLLDAYDKYKKDFITHKLIDPVLVSDKDEIERLKKISTNLLMRVKDVISHKLIETN